MLSAADFAVVGVYAVLMTWIGLVARRKTANVDEYLSFMSKMEEDPGFGKFFNSHIYHWFNNYLCY